MKILVTTKAVLDPDQKIQLDASGSMIDLCGESLVLNPFDEIALEEAVRMRENGADVDEIILVSIGGAGTEKVLRTGLAMGADRAIWIVTDQVLPSWNICDILFEVVGRENPELVLMGKQAVDSDGNQTGQMLAARLDWAQATFVSEIKVEDQYLVARREVDEGIETLEVDLPVVVTCDLRLNEPRYASLPAILKAKRKPLDRFEVSEFSLDSRNTMEVISFEMVDDKRNCVFVEDLGELVDKLRNEAKVIS